jgi:hypothetical protein
VKGTKEGKRTGKGKATEEVKGNGNGNDEGKDIVTQTPGGDDISRAVPVQMQKEMYKADLDCYAFGVTGRLPGSYRITP